MDELDNAIQRALRAFGSSEHETEHDIVLALTAEGLAATEAEKLVALVPLAFGRVLLSHVGRPSFPDTFLLPLDSGGYVQRRLRSEPIFVRALAVAAHMYHHGPRSLFQAAATSSAEVAATNKALHAGSSPTDLHFAEPILLRLTARQWDAGL